jgi:hypothetical protein
MEIRSDRHPVVAVKGQALEAAERRDVLILLPDRLAEPVDLDVARHLGQLLRVQRLVPVQVQRLQERGGEAAGRPEARARRDVREGGDLDLRGPQALQRQSLPDDRMPHLLDPLDVLERRVFQVDPGLERPRHRHVDVLVDGGGDQKSLALGVVRRKIGAAAAQRDPERAAGDDHAPAAVA